MGGSRGFPARQGILQKVRNEEFPVTANLFQCFPIGDSCKKYLDILAGEKTDLRMRQDGWYRFAHGWLNGKDCCFVEDPNQYIRDINEDIKMGLMIVSFSLSWNPSHTAFMWRFPMAPGCKIR